MEIVVDPNKEETITDFRFLISITGNETVSRLYSM